MVTNFAWERRHLAGTDKKSLPEAVRLSIHLLRQCRLEAGAPRQCLYAALLSALLLPLLAGCGTKTAEPEHAAPTAETVATTKVLSRVLEREMILPGEILAFQDVPIYPKVPGFIQWIGIDRGSVVKKDQVLIKVIAPELDAEVQEAQAKVKAAEASWHEAQAKLASDREQRLKAMAKHQANKDTYERLKEAYKTPGVVAYNDVEIAQKLAEADLAQVNAVDQVLRQDQALVKSQEEKVKAAQKQMSTRSDIRAYLTVTAPFDGIITERNTHTGSFVGPPAGPIPMVRIRELSLLRLVIPVPEIAVGGLKEGDEIYFTVAAYPGQKFSGHIRRIGHYLDEKTRTMPIELNVHNPSWKLSPGMFANVIWPSTRKEATLFVPSTAVASTSERTFLVRIKDGVVKWVDVKRGQPMPDRSVKRGEPHRDLIEVFGDIKDGDEVALRGTDELKEGEHVIASLKAPKLDDEPEDRSQRFRRSYGTYE